MERGPCHLTQWSEPLVMEVASNYGRIPQADHKGNPRPLSTGISSPPPLERKILDHQRIPRPWREPQREVLASNEEVSLLAMKGAMGHGRSPEP